MPVIDLPKPAPQTSSHLEALYQELRLARQASDEFFKIIKESSLYDRPIDARHRVVFYIGHLDGFDSITICREHLHLPSPDPELDALFQAGIDPDSTHLPQDQPSDWPKLQQVLSYVERCRNRVDEHLSGTRADIIEMALEHRLMHLETLAYMFHNLPYACKRQPVQQEIITSGEVPENQWIAIPDGFATLGQQPAVFGWDNEFDAWRAAVPAFRIQKYSVTNGEYLRFVEAGGPPPHFWAQCARTYLWRGMFEEFPLPLDWPVYVTQQQAQSYADWIGASLPSEAQFHRAAYGQPDGQERRYPWGNQAPDPNFGNFDFRRWDPEPVRMNTGNSAFGVSQLVGNAWQWTVTPFQPFAGFKPRTEYPGYSANFFDNEHFVMKGGSPRTAARFLRQSFRNWFRRDYPYMYAGFRCVRTGQ